MIENAKSNYNKQILNACQILPELNTHLFPNPSFSSPNQKQQTDYVNFYRYFASDLMVYKMTSWIGNGAKSCYTDRYDTFKYYPEIGVLTAINVSKVDALLLGDDWLVTHFAETFIRRMFTTLEIFFKLYFTEFATEVEANKKVHKFQLMN